MNLPLMALTVHWDHFCGVLRSSHAIKVLGSNFPQTAGKTEKGLRHYLAASPYMRRCRRQDLNLHSLYGNQLLKLARLPVPPLRQGGILLHHRLAIGRVKLPVAA